VADGRDIGTVVFPEAELKIFLVADARERARRRLREQGVAAPDDAAMWAEEARLAGRDEIDTTRAVAPLLQALDAVVIDTTRLGFEEQVEMIGSLVRERARG
jgi:cytidylate kinase